MSNYIDAVDWVEVILFAPVWVSIFGIGVCLRCLVADWNRSEPPAETEENSHAQTWNR